MSTVIQRLVCSLLLLTPGILYAQGSTGAPNAITYQGFLTQSGIPVNTPQNIAVKLFDDASGGNLVWDRIYSGVPVANGIYSLTLEGGDAEGSNTDSLGTVSFGAPLWLQTEIGGEILSERTALAGVPYAMSLRNLRVIPTSYSHRPGAVNIIGGATDNSVTEGRYGATIGGGGVNDVDVGLTYGGCTLYEPLGANMVGDQFGTIGGGTGNRACAFATVGGGLKNTAGVLAATVGGGGYNSAKGEFSTISGGVQNRAVGDYSTVPGGYYNQARGDYSFAAGSKARADYEGTFVWNDRSSASGNDSLVSTGQNQFLIRASGGVGIGTNSPSNQLSVVGDADFTGNVGIGTDNPLSLLHVSGTGHVRLERTDDFNARLSMIASTGSEWRVVSTGTSDPDGGGLFQIRDVSANADRFTITSGGRIGFGTSTPDFPLEVGTDNTNGNKAHLTAGGVWTSASSRTVKEGFEPIDTRDILNNLSKLPVLKWRYKGTDEGEHIGPMAEDFRAVFGLGHTDKGITMVDADGIALAAIQGLYHLVREKDQENQKLRDQVEAQDQRLATLEHLFEKAVGSGFEQ